MQDEVSDVEPFELYPLIVVLGHLLLVLGHSLRGLIFDFVQTIQVQLQLVVVAAFDKELLLEAGEPYFDGDNCLCAICQVELCLSCSGSCCGSVSP